MAWSRRRKNPNNELAFKGATDAIQNEIYKMAQRHYALASQAFTMNELMQLFVPPNHHHVLREAFALAAPRSTYNLFVAVDVPEEYEAAKMLLRFGWDWRHKDGFLPRTVAGAFDDKPVKGIEPECPPELAQRFRQTATDLAEVAYKYGMAKYVFNELNIVGKTPAAVRYHFPCVVALLERNGAYTEEVNAIREPNMRAGDGLALPAKVRPFIRQANEFIARAMLIEADGPTQELPVSYIIYTASPFHGLFTLPR